MKVGKGPVDEIKVKIIEAKIGKRLAARGNDLIFAVPVIP
jgi:hypothetical protein